MAVLRRGAGGGEGREGLGGARTGVAGGLRPARALPARLLFQPSFRARCPSTAARAGEQPPAAAPLRAAALHDFCMGLPYGFVALLAGGALAVLLGAPGRQAGTALALGGAAALAASVGSLRLWKSGGDSRFPFTTALFAVAAGEAAAPCGSRRRETDSCAPWGGGLPRLAPYSPHSVCTTSSPGATRPARARTDVFFARKPTEPGWTVGQKVSIHSPPAKWQAALTFHALRILDY